MPDEVGAGEKLVVAHAVDAVGDAVV